MGSTSVIEEYANYLRYELNRSPLTVNSYVADLAEFEAYFKQKESQLSWEVIDADLIRDWIESMMDKGNIAASVNRRLSALRSFYRFMLFKGLVTADPTRTIHGLKKKRPLPQFLREGEMDRLLDTVDTGTSFSDVRTRTIILTFYSTGIRLSELTGLNDADIDLDTRQLRVSGKRDKQRIIPFGDELAECLRHYMETRDRQVPHVGSALFVDKRGKRLNATKVRRDVKANLALVSTLRKRSPHVLRHTFATAMLNHQARLESIQKLLGHESPGTTEIYAHTTFEQLKKEYTHAHPRA